MTPLGPAQRRMPRQVLSRRRAVHLVRHRGIFLLSVGGHVRQLGLFGFIEMLVFVGILLIGYVYAWKKGGGWNGNRTKSCQYGRRHDRSLEAAVNWARTKPCGGCCSALACCAIEMMSAQAANFDMSRFGMEIDARQPAPVRFDDLRGACLAQMAPVLRHSYDQMPDPKWVVANGRLRFERRMCLTTMPSFKVLTRSCQWTSISPAAAAGT